MIHINKVKGTNLEITKDMSDYLEKKIQMLDKFVDPDDSGASIDVEIEKTTNHHQKGDVYRAEFNFVMRGKGFRSESTVEDIYTAIDEAKDDLAREITEYQNKSRGKKRKEGAFLKRLMRGFRK